MPIVVSVFLKIHELTNFHIVLILNISCGPGFESQAQHQCFFISYLTDLSLKCENEQKIELNKIWTRLAKNLFLSPTGKNLPNQMDNLASYVKGIIIVIIKINGHYFFLAGSVFLEQDIPIQKSFEQIISGINADQNILNGTRVDHNIQYVLDDPFDAHQKICMEMSYRYSKGFSAISECALNYVSTLMWKF